MKHNTHIYIAAKAIELMRQCVDNTVKPNGHYISGTEKSKERKMMVEVQRILQYYSALAIEASWAPDDVLRDNDPYHIFKLFTDDEFPNHQLTHLQKWESNGMSFYKYAGGLPYRIDHIAQEIVNMNKLRDYNDHYTMQQIAYNIFMLSHYVSDAHVPMHCDLRDDPPGSRTDQPSRRSGGGKPDGKYMKSSTHNKIEQMWDDAVNPVAFEEEQLKQTWVKEETEHTGLSECVRFGFNDCKKGKDVKVKIIPNNKLMDFMVDVCLQSKIRGRELFPVDNPKELNEDALPQVTRDIFADAIGNLISVMRYIWVKSML